jgi:hypothetical protein
MKKQECLGQMTASMEPNPKPTAPGLKHPLAHLFGVARNGNFYWRKGLGTFVLRQSGRGNQSKTGTYSIRHERPTRRRSTFHLAPREGALKKIAQGNDCDETSHERSPTNPNIQGQSRMGGVEKGYGTESLYR